VREELYDVVPVPSLVELFAVVGAVAVFQTTPFAEMVPPPAVILLPPLLAVEAVTEETAVVVTDAGLTAVPAVVGAEAVR